MSDSLISQLQHSYGFGKTLALPFNEAIERTRQVLQQQGFGVLFEIDLKAKLQEKLGVEIQQYVILGACNPPIAYQALQAEADIGLLLPCNVIVYDRDGKSEVVAIDAAKMMTIVGNPNLEAKAHQINAMLQQVIESL